MTKITVFQGNYTAGAKKICWLLLRAKRSISLKFLAGPLAVLHPRIASLESGEILVVRSNPSPSRKTEPPPLVRKSQICKNPGFWGNFGVPMAVSRGFGTKTRRRREKYGLLAVLKNDFGLSSRSPEKHSGLSRSPKKSGVCCCLRGFGLKMRRRREKMR